MLYFSVVNKNSLLESCLSGLGTDLQVRKTRLSTDTVQAGQAITYTLAVSNVGPTEPVTATLVDHWSPVGAVSAVSAPGCSVDLAGGVLTCTHQNLAVGASVLYTTVFTASDVFSGTFTNTVSITSSNQVDFRLSNNEAGPVSVEFFTEGLLYLPVIFKN